MNDTNMEASEASGAIGALLGFAAAATVCYRYLGILIPNTQAIGALPGSSSDFVQFIVGSAISVAGGIVGCRVAVFVHRDFPR